MLDELDVEGLLPIALAPRSRVARARVMFARSCPGSTGTRPQEWQNIKVVLSEPGCKLVPKALRCGERETSFTSLRQGFGSQAQATLNRGHP